MPLDGQAGGLGGVLGTLLGGVDGALGAGLELGAHGLVAQAAPLVLAVPLDLALDVGHGSPSSCGRAGAAPSPAPDTESTSIAAGRPARHPPDPRRSRRPGGGTRLDRSRPPPTSEDPSRPWPALDRYRNLCIIAHIDHGKSTLADRLLELCGAVDPRDMRAQYLDSMDLERERGITIKLQSVRLELRRATCIHLIDTPGHVDFGYEVSRSLAACEGAILLVDAAQGIEAQTLANCYLALEHDLEIVAALNKIDLPAAEPGPLRRPRSRSVLGIPADEILRISAKTGEGVAGAARRGRRAHPRPGGRPRRAAAGADLRLPLRPVPGRRLERCGSSNGTLATGARLRFLQAGATHDADEIGVRRPAIRRRSPSLGRRRGRLPHRRHQGRRRGPLGRDHHPRRRPGAAAARATRSPSRWCSAGSTRSTATSSRPARGAREAAAQRLAPSRSSPRPRARSGFGFRCGFLGLLHMEIIRERLEREFDLSLIATAPVGRSTIVAHGRRSTIVTIDNPSEMPPATEIDDIEEPVLDRHASSPRPSYTGTLMELCQQRRGEMAKLEYLSPERVELVYRLPLAEVVTDFFDQLKSRTQGYASLDYEPAGYRALEAGEGRHPAQRQCRWTPSARSCTRTRPTTTAGG